MAVLTVAVDVEDDSAAGWLVSASRFRFMDFFDSEVSMSSGKVTSFVTINSSSPKAAAAAALPAWPMAVLVRVD